MNQEAESEQLMIRLEKLPDLSPPSVLQGWVLEGIPQTRLQALSLQQAGVIPHHVGELNDRLQYVCKLEIVV